MPCKSAASALHTKPPGRSPANRPVYSLRLACSRGDLDRLSAELWESGTIGIQEIESGLIAAFDSDARRSGLLEQFAPHSPDWQSLPAVDWIAHTQNAWPPRPIGERLFLAAPWRDDPTPPGRERLLHNPGLASGTGEHPCTQLALIALEKVLPSRAIVLDVGTGSGILSIAALRLGALGAIGLDPDHGALAVARENFCLNGFAPTLIAGSLECLGAAIADVTVANINATVLLSLFDDLLRVTRPNGVLILTGFTAPEASALLRLLPHSEVSGLAEWRCIQTALIPSAPSPVPARLLTSGRP